MDEDSLEFEHLDALNMMSCHNGLNRMDLFVMSIGKDIIDDLLDEGYCRSKLFSWKITRKGVKALENEGIDSFWDTRGY